MFQKQFGNLRASTAPACRWERTLIFPVRADCDCQMLHVIMNFGIRTTLPSLGPRCSLVLVKHKCQSLCFLHLGAFHLALVLEAWLTVGPNLWDQFCNRQPLWEGAWVIQTRVGFPQARPCVASCSGPCCVPGNPGCFPASGRWWGQGAEGSTLEKEKGGRWLKNVFLKWAGLSQNPRVR